MLDNLLRLLDNLKIDASLCLYSQGTVGDFQELKKYKIKFHLNECLFTTFHSLASADVLVMSKSAFSYIAALLSEGVKMYEPFWHYPLEDWIVTNEQADFDQVVFKKKINEILLQRYGGPPNLGNGVSSESLSKKMTNEA